MRNPLGCYRCDEQVGWVYTYTWGPNGCDPPDIKLWDEELVDNGRCFCSQECLKLETRIEEETNGKYTASC